MALRAGGILVAEFVEPSEDVAWTVSDVDPRQLAEWLIEGGAKSVSHTEVTGGKRRTIRLVGEW
jgi:hypothetical protein